MVDILSLESLRESEFVFLPKAFGLSDLLFRHEGSGIHQLEY
jgi:hypothetical protein